ncbi:hypothetical protein CO172_01150 [Candidatus Uhrbacteria bacterium CG_4_9_14_3_um_filter_36_7]|uniref:DUF4012 domain-containing protein n=1 Tax=Candidatus Uhrbacteria bacterium CG_4_9_14_3_um_filter_36_7 TaxID=1975033 RepID=A0A2M7XI28_9BACT|nr:MAG: hypothetical protein CO172_01150 [Candidatus Uhrbacteria bacterium CG_4_9_14_3_um_filter_36_7]
MKQEGSNKRSIKKNIKKHPIYRRKKAVCVTYLYDSSIPAHLIFYGLLPNRSIGTPKSLPIHISKQQHLSPFLLELQKPSQNLDLASSKSTDPVFNFLPCKHENFNESLSQISQKNSLHLEKQEILSQLLEKNNTPTASTKYRQQLVKPIESHKQSRNLGMNLISCVQERLQRQTKKEILPIGWQRAVGIFLLFSFAFVLPLHAIGNLKELSSQQVSIEKQSLEAFSHVYEATSALLNQKHDSATSAFFEASQTFDGAQKTLAKLNQSTAFLLSWFPSTKETYKTGQELLLAGTLLSRVGTNITSILKTIADYPDLTLTQKLNLFSSQLSILLPDLIQAKNHLNHVEKKHVPVAYQETFEEIQKSLPILESAMHEFLTVSHVLEDLLGSKEKQRYLVVFQNNMEIRPTGGFLGSFAEIAIDQGEVVDLYFPAGGTYDLQGSLQTFTIAPKPLQLINPRFEFQDVNWFVDFPTSARKMLEFYQASGQSTVDGVIAINASFVADLLSIIGPVKLSSYERTFTAENFILESQKIAEIDYKIYENNSSSEKPGPKAFLGKLAPCLLTSIKQAPLEKLIPLFNQMRKGLKEKDIQLYFIDPQKQKVIHDLRWDGQIQPTNGDYLLVVDSNIGGQKTDGVIDQEINLSIDISKTGEIINTLKITRKHAGISGSLFTGVNNVDYMRVYVPKGSQLMHADGFTPPDEDLFETPEPNWKQDTDIFSTEHYARIDANSGVTISEEFGKTVFGHWVQTKPGETKTVTFVYQLPFSIHHQSNSWMQKLTQAIGIESKQIYQLFIQKQPGILDRNTSVMVHLPPNQDIIESSGLVNESTLFSNKTDHFYYLIFEDET